MMTVPAFSSRLEYLRHNYAIWASLIPTASAINKDISRLKRALSGARPEDRSEEMPLDPFVAAAINLRARQGRSGEIGRPINDARMLAACIEVAKVARPIRGRPSANVLVYHVRGFMTLCLESLDKPVSVSRSRHSLYEPRWPDRLGEALETFFRGIDRTITRTQLVNIVRETHRTGAIEGRRFLDLFPLYGGSLDPVTSTLTPAPGYEVQTFDLFRPIYCP